MKVSPLAVSLVALSIGCSGAGHAEDATNFTRDANQAVLDALPFETDGVDYDWANRGFIVNREYHKQYKWHCSHDDLCGSALLNRDPRVA